MGLILGSTLILGQVVHKKIGKIFSFRLYGLILEKGRVSNKNRYSIDIKMLFSMIISVNLTLKYVRLILIS